MIAHQQEEYTMGYWSCGIMGGDGPQEFAGDLQEKFMFRPATDPAVLEWIEAQYDNTEAALVLGFQMIIALVDITPVVRERIVTACTEAMNECDDNDDGKERQSILAQFRDIISSDETPEEKLKQITHEIAG